MAASGSNPGGSGANNNNDDMSLDSGRSSPGPSTPRGAGDSQAANTAGGEYGKLPETDNSSANNRMPADQYAAVNNPMIGTANYNKTQQPPEEMRNAGGKEIYGTGKPLPPLPGVVGGMSQGTRGGHPTAAELAKAQTAGPQRPAPSGVKLPELDIKSSFSPKPK